MLEDAIGVAKGDRGYKDLPRLGTTVHEGSLAYILAHEVQPLRYFEHKDRTTMDSHTELTSILSLADGYHGLHRWW